MPPLLKALNDAETIVPDAPVSTPAKKPDTTIPIGLDTYTSVLKTASTATVLKPDSTPAQTSDSTNPIILDTYTPVLATTPPSRPSVLAPVVKHLPKSDATNPIDLDTSTPVLGRASNSTPTVLAHTATPDAANSINLDTCTPVLGSASTSTDDVITKSKENSSMELVAYETASESENFETGVQNGIDILMSEEFYRVPLKNEAIEIAPEHLNSKTVTVTPLGNEQIESLNPAQELDTSDKSAQNETMENLTEKIPGDVETIQGLLN